MKLEDIRKLSEDAIAQEIQRAELKLFELKMKAGVRQLEKTADVAKTKRLIARLNTVAREKALQINAKLNKAS